MMGLGLRGRRERRPYKKLNSATIFW